MKECERSGCPAGVQPGRQGDPYCSQLCRSIVRFEVRLKRAAQTAEACGKPQTLNDRRWDALQDVSAAVDRFRALYPKASAASGVEILEGIANGKSRPH